MPIKTVYIGLYPSQSKPSLRYTVQLNVETGESSQGLAWLSCDCPSWCKGKQQAGKSPQQRTCKHTFAAEIEHASEISLARTVTYTTGRTVRLAVQNAVAWGLTQTVEVTPESEMTVKIVKPRPAQPTPDGAESGRFASLEL